MSLTLGVVLLGWSVVVFCSAPVQAPSAVAPTPQAPSGSLDAGAPPLKVEPALLDLGFLPPRKGGKGTVTLTNTGPVPLTIAAVTPSCKCTTTTPLAGKVIPPGGSETMEAVLEGAAMPQTHRASIKVAVEGYAQVLEFGIKGETTNPVRFVPSIINAVEGKPRSGRFLVESVDKQPFRICSIAGRAPEFVGHSPSDAPKSQYLVKYDLDSWGADLPSYLVMETDRADCPVTDIWVRTERSIPQPVFRMKDYRTNAGRIDLGGSTEVALEMEDPGQEILGISSDSPEVQLEIVGQQAKAGSRSVTVRVMPRSPRPGLLYTPFAIHTADRDQRLTLFASVRPAGAQGCVGCDPAPGLPSAPPPRDLLAPAPAR